MPNEKRHRIILQIEETSAKTLDLISREDCRRGRGKVIAWIIRNISDMVQVVGYDFYDYYFGNNGKFRLDSIGTKGESTLCLYAQECESLKKDLELARVTHLWDFYILLCWKFFMLFTYQKFRQIALVRGSEFFINEWTKEFKNAPKRYSLENLYWPNAEDSIDEKVISILLRFYNPDPNYRNLITPLKQKRHAVAHLSEHSNTRANALSYLNEITQMLKILQDLHFKHFWSNMQEGDFVSLIRNQTLSRADMKNIIPRAISYFEKSASTSFDSSSTWKECILKLAPQFAPNDIEKVFDAVFQHGKHSINQMLESHGTCHFFLELLNLNLTSDEKWIIFAKRLGKYLSERKSNLSDYNGLFSRLGLKQFPKTTA